MKIDVKLNGSIRANLAMHDIAHGGMRYTFSVAGGALTAAQLNAIFHDLKVVEGQTITITGNPGAGDCNPTIAMAKGWTVVN